MLLGVLMAMGFVGAIILGVPSFIMWIAQEHRLANKYRALELYAKTEVPKLLAQAAANAPVAGGSIWEIVYLERGKNKTVRVSGTSEAEAVKNFVKQYGVKYSGIVSSIKVA